MGTPLDPKCVPYTYMDPLGLIQSETLRLPEQYKPSEAQGSTNYCGHVSHSLNSLTGGGYIGGYIREYYRGYLGGY